MWDCLCPGNPTLKYKLYQSENEGFYYQICHPLGLAMQTLACHVTSLGLSENSCKITSKIPLKSQIHKSEECWTE